MENLITINYNNESPVVSAKELHEFLEVNTRFDVWMKRVLEYGFEEDLDFCTKMIKSPMGRPSKEYALTLDCAKEISMLQRNEKGKEARKYFINIEKKFRQQKKTPIDFSNADDVLKIAQSYAEEQKRRILLEKENKQLKPKAELMDRVLDSDRTIDIGQAAKILELPYGRNTFFKKLRNKGILFKNKNEPKQLYISQGLFKLKETVIEREAKDNIVAIKVLVTQKGLAFLANRFDSQPSNKLMANIS